MVATQKIQVGLIHAGKIVTITAEDHTFRLFIGGQAVGTVPRTTASEIHRYKAYAAHPRTRCRKPAGGARLRAKGSRVPHTETVSGLSREARAWRRFWRSPTPRQAGDAALARLAAAEELAETPADFNNLADPFDLTLAEIATDPSVVQFDKARRVHAGQTARRLKRRQTAAKKRREH